MSDELVPAAQYVRTATERHDHSTLLQSAALRAFASKHGIHIVRTFMDSCKSGLRIDDRPGLQALLDVIRRGEAAFATVLVYDVSRWGRFEETVAHCERICAQAGISIQYCAEMLKRDHPGFAKLRGQ